MKFNNETLKEAVEEWCSDSQLAQKKYGHISNWDTSQVTSMRRLFFYRFSFNEDISQWNTSNVIDMWGTFDMASSFNQPIGNWDVSKVTDMGDMFNGAKMFNQDLNGWNTENVENMREMFREAISFNSPINKWNVSKVQSMMQMFCDAIKFNQDISKWDVSNVDSMHSMFCNAISFDKDINEWHLKSSCDISEMFQRAISFNKQINRWDINDSDWKGVFKEAWLFNLNFSPKKRLKTEIKFTQHKFNNLSLKRAVFEWVKDNESSIKRYGHISTWDVSKVTNMSKLFSVYSEFECFNDNISSWDVSNVKNMSKMFSGAKLFNQPIGNWDVSKVTDMREMFYNAENFNQPIGNWDVSKVTDMREMFYNAKIFCQDLTKWNTYNQSRMFTGAKAFQKLYDPITLKKKNDHKLDASDKKLITKLKKLFNSRDYSNIDSAIEILRTLDDKSLFEYFLTGIKLLDGEFVKSKLFTGNRNSQSYLDYTLVLLINYAPVNAEIDESIKRENIKKIQLSAEFERETYDGYVIPDCGQFTTSRFPKLHFPNLKELILVNYENIENVEFLIECINLKKLDLSCSSVDVDTSVLKHIEGLEVIF